MLSFATAQKNSCNEETPSAGVVLFLFQLLEISRVKIQMPNLKIRSPGDLYFHCFFSLCGKQLWNLDARNPNFPALNQSSKN
jgi:hypothetical protein